MEPTYNEAVTQLFVSKRRTDLPEKGKTRNINDSIQNFDILPTSTHILCCYMVTRAIIRYLRAITYSISCNSKRKLKETLLLAPRFDLHPRQSLSGRD